MNIPNILGNKLDQVPKNTNTRYQARIDAMQNEIIKAFDRFVDMDGDQNVLDRIERNQDLLPLNKLAELKDNKAFSFEIKREKRENKGGRIKSIGPLVDPMTLPTFKTHILSKNQNNLEPGDIVTYLVIKKKVSKPGFEANRDYKASIEQLEIPHENALLSKGFVFHRELKGEAVNEFSLD